MTTIEGDFFDGMQPVAFPGRLEFTAGNARLATERHDIRLALSDLQVSPRVATAKRFIKLPEGRQFVCGDDPFLDTLPQQSPAEGVVAWLENRWPVALAGVVLIAALLSAGYFWGLPVLAREVVARMPLETEQALGREALDWFDREGWTERSELDGLKQNEIRAAFIRLHAHLPIRYFYQLEFRASRYFGPNAFALPGGIIVVTDDLVKLAQNTDEVTAVLAHEIGHAALRHGMRSILQNSIVGAVAAAVTADAATLSVAVAGLPVLLAQTRYSRKFEREADDYALALMVRSGISPNAFAAIMERLAQSHGRKAAPFAYFSTHPAIEERIRKARTAASAQIVEP
jgi:Zn-dependent protease with chaperone function